MANINYTFIIPHKNIPALLKRCLDSIPKREDIQIIIVDDNSDPDKVDFGHFPGLDEPCVEVYFTKEGKGAGYARNIGLKYARGKWLLFADADDYYMDGFIAVLDSYVQTDYDIIYYNVCSNVEGEYDRSIVVNKIYNEYFNRKVDINYVKYLLWIPWNKMFLKRFVFDNNILFEEIPVGNDAFFSLNSSKKALKYVVLKDKLYCNTYNANSITFSVRNFEREIDYLRVNLRINNFLRLHGLKDNQMCVVSYKILNDMIDKYGLVKTFKYLCMVHKLDSVFLNLIFWFRLKFSKCNSLK